jgi:hypothetical protein
MSKPIIIDSCVISKVFNELTEGHDDFHPVVEAMNKGKCHMLYGGSKYLKELAKLERFIPLFNKLKKAAMMVRVDDKKVDKEQERIEQLITQPDFDDPHLPAMAIVGNCHLICSDDKRCIEYIKKRELYPTHFSTPRFYSRKEHRGLLYNKA